TIADFTYDVAWYPTTKGGGFAMEVIDPVINPDLSAAGSWRAGTTLNGTPAAENSITLSGVPGSATATPVSTTQVNLQWVDGVSGEAGYRVFRRGSIDAPFVQIADIAANATSYSDNNGGAGLAPGTSYEYRIQAYAAGGAGFSGYAGATATTLVPAPIGLTAA